MLDFEVVYIIAVVRNPDMKIGRYKGRGACRWLDTSNILCFVGANSHLPAM